MAGVQQGLRENVSSGLVPQHQARELSETKGQLNRKLEAMKPKKV